MILNAFLNFEPVPDENNLSKMFLFITFISSVLWLASSLVVTLKTIGFTIESLCEGPPSCGTKFSVKWTNKYIHLDSLILTIGGTVIFSVARLIGAFVIWIVYHNISFGSCSVGIGLAIIYISGLLLSMLLYSLSQAMTYPDHTNDKEKDK